MFLVANVPNSLDTESEARFFLRRLLNTFLPPTVAMRDLNPSDRIRGVFFGCHVRFVLAIVLITGKAF